MTTPSAGHVVTGGGRGVGWAVVERLLSDGAHVAVIELEQAALEWVADHPATERLVPVVGSAADETVTARAVEQVEAQAPLRGWVNNAAVFRDADLHEASTATVVDLVVANLAPVVAGSAAAVRCFLANDRPGAIVNVSSHQAQPAVRGALPYATAKAAVEGLTRATAVDYGPHRIRANAVALGSVATERFEELLASQPDEAERIERDIARLHPVGRIGRGEDVASTVAFLLSDAASFVSGAVLPVDGGRSAQGQDLEEGGGL